MRSVGGHARHRCTRKERALAVVAVVAGLVLGLSGAAGAAGILPPDNPSANIPPSNGDFLISIDSARAQEGLGPMDVNEAQLNAMPAPQQLFIVLNDERIDRGLPPIEFMTAQLDAAANQGAQSGGDPPLPSSVTGGAPVAWGGGIWAGGSPSVLESDYYWMYSDGAGSDSSNEACPSAGSPSCWMHRDIILHALPSCGAQPSTLSLGAADDPAGYPGGSLATEIIASCGTPADVTMTWQQAESEVAGDPDGRRGLHAQRDRLLGGRSQRHGGCVRHCAQFRVADHWAQRTDRGDRGHTQRRRLLAGRLRRRHLQLRERSVLRLHRFTSAQQADRRHGHDAGRKRLLAGRLRRRHLQLRRCEVPRFDGRPATQPARGRHGG